MSEYNKGIENLRNKHYEEAANDLCKFISKDKLTTETNNIKEEREKRDKLHLSNTELKELCKNAIDYFENKIKKSQDNLDTNNFCAGIIYTIGNNVDNEYFDKVFKLSNDITLLGKLGVIYGKYQKYDKAIGCFEKILQIEPNNKEALDSIQAINNHRKK